MRPLKTAEMVVRLRSARERMVARTCGSVALKLTRMDSMRSLYLTWNGTANTCLLGVSQVPSAVPVV